MQTTQTFEQWFEQADNALPVLTETARIVVVVLGLLLLLLGSKLVKPACIAGGAMLGMILGGLSMGFVDATGLAVGLVIGLGMLGALGAWLIFRAWVAFAAALVFAIASPAGVMVWQGITAQELSDDTQVAAQQLEQRYNAASSQLSEDTKLQIQSLIQQGDIQSLNEADKLITEQGGKALDNARSVVFRNIEELSAWWQANSTQRQRTVGLAMLIGAGVGLLLGLVLPSVAVAIQSAIVGSVLIVIPGRELVMTHLPVASDFVPKSAHTTLVTLSLITLVGLVMQWRLHRRPDDKEE